MSGGGSSAGLVVVGAVAGCAVGFGIYAVLLGGSPYSRSRERAASLGDYDVPPSPRAEPSYLKRNKALVRRLYRSVWNETDLARATAAVKDLVSEEHILVDPSDPNPEPGWEGYLASVKSFRSALPDFTIMIDELIAEKSKVTAQLSFKGSAGGLTARWTATAVLEVEDSQIIRSWVNSDALSALIQLGLLDDIATGPFARRAATKGAGQTQREVVTALLGRQEAHPESVLTGQDWLDYFHNIAQSSTSQGIGQRKESRLRLDDNTGLDIVV